MNDSPHFAVKCKYCDGLIPLAVYNTDLHYKLADSFFARHSEQVSDSKCQALGIYSFSDLDKHDFTPVYNLVPNLSFAEKILLR
jgi:hypothetical protein